MSAQDPLPKFILEQKDTFLKDLQEGNLFKQWVVATGNEAGDLDSIASALGYAYFASQLKDAQPHVPLVYTSRSDLYLRPENILALKSAGIEIEDLLCLNDIPLDKLNILKPAFALVDQNRLLPTFGDNKVTAIIDHHADEGQSLDASPRIIKGSGSCSSLVTCYFEPLLPTRTVPPALANLLLSALLIDTGLKAAPKGKATPDDLAAANFLAPFCSFAAGSALLDSMPELGSYTQLLWAKKADVASLSGRDLLRRDYKEYQLGPWTYGLSTVPLPLKDWLAKGDGWNLVEADMESWMKERRLHMAGVLTSYRAGEKTLVKGSGGQQGREVLLRVADPKLEQAFIDIEKDETLRLEKWKGHPALTASTQWKVWQQANLKATRKQVAPAIKAVLTKLI